MLLNKLPKTEYSSVRRRHCQANLEQLASPFNTKVLEFASGQFHQQLDFALRPFKVLNAECIYCNHLDTEFQAPV